MRNERRHRQCVKRDKGLRTLTLSHCCSRAIPSCHTRFAALVFFSRAVCQKEMIWSSSYLTAILTVLAVTALCVRNLRALDFGTAEEQDATLSE